MSFLTLTLRSENYPRMVNTEQIQQFWLNSSSTRIEGDTNLSLYIQFAGHAQPFEFFAINADGSQIIKKPRNHEEMQALLRGTRKFLAE